MGGGMGAEFVGNTFPPGGAGAGHATAGETGWCKSAENAGHSAYIIDELDDGGATATGWNNGDITDAGSAGLVHGPWGNDFRDAQATFQIPAGVTRCRVSWRSWSIDSRDNEWDRVYLQGTLMWQRQVHYNCRDLSDGQTNGNGWTNCCRNGDFPQHWGNNNDICYQDQVHEIDCSSGSVTARFTSDIDQGRGDESWAFSRFRILMVDPPPPPDPEPDPFWDPGALALPHPTPFAIPFRCVRGLTPRHRSQ